MQRRASGGRRFGGNRIANHSMREREIQAGCGCESQQTEIEQCVDRGDDLVFAPRADFGELLDAEPFADERRDVQHAARLGR